MVAAGFENGLAVFHVALPLACSPTDRRFHPLPEPTDTTVVSSAPMVSPLVAKRWQGKHERTFVSWLDLGPHVNPCIALLLHSAANASVLLGMVDFPTYHKTILVNEETIVPFRLLASSTVPKESAFCPVGVLQSNGTKEIVAYSEKKLFVFCLSSSTLRINNPSLSSLGHPITSCLPGLTSSGDPLLLDADADSDGILHIFSTLQCERQTVASTLEWARPMRRFWLCRTMALDTIGSAAEAKDNYRLEDGEAAGGTVSDVVCDLSHESLIGLRPFRLVRCRGTNVCAVVFRHEFRVSAEDSTSMSFDTTSIVLVDFSGKLSLEIVQGRDICFLPNDGSEVPRGVILSCDGSSLTYFTFEGSKVCMRSSACRPLVGVDTDKEYIDCRRIFAFSEGSKTNLAVLGKRWRDDRVCFVLGDLCNSNVTCDTWTALLPNIVTGRTAWLEAGEKVFSAVGLQGDGSGYRNFALSTSTRVMILSSVLAISAEARVLGCCHSLAPLGFFAVSYLSKNTVHYLCCLEGRFANGIIASVTEPACGYSHNALLAVMQDRLLFLPRHSGVRLVEHGRNPNIFLLPTATIRPALLLEPMIANAVCVGGKRSISTSCLRTVIEKFGRKVSSITQGDNEGIGQLGAGITGKTFELLEHYGLKHAGSWLLTGTVKFDRLTNTRLLPPWVPVGPKSAGAFNADAFLHVISNGDSYFADYIKSPDKIMASPLPKKSTSSAYACHEYAREAIKRGKALDAVKMLDVEGAESADSLVLQLVLMLEKEKGNDAAGVMKSLCGYSNGVSSLVADPVTTSGSLAALALFLKLKAGDSRAPEMSDSEVERWIKPLAPSLQRGAREGRSRQSIFGEKDLESAGRTEADTLDSMWISPCNETKHVW
jgi:hypothetical protein